jgi:cell division transport system permease protein
VVAWAILWGAVHLLNTGLAELSELYGTPLALAYLSPVESAALLAFSALLGWLGSWLSVSQHLGLVRLR